MQKRDNLNHNVRMNKDDINCPLVHLGWKQGYDHMFQEGADLYKAGFTIQFHVPMIQAVQSP